MRPTTARRRPPRVKDNQVRQLDQAGGGPGAGGSGGAGAGGPKAVGHIMVDGADAVDSDEDEAKDEAKGGGLVADTTEGASNLVRDIESEARKGAGGAAEAKAGEAKAGEGGIRLGRVKKTATKPGAKKSMSNWSEQDIEQLRVSVQRLCQSTNPLGKCMDFVHDDLAAMNKEHDRWTHEYAENSHPLPPPRAFAPPPRDQIVAANLGIRGVLGSKRADVISPLLARDPSPPRLSASPGTARNWTNWSARRRPRRSRCSRCSSNSWT